jgi:hypothetical protein
VNGPAVKEGANRRLRRSALGALTLAAMSAALVPAGSAHAQWAIGLQTGATLSTLTGSFVRNADPVLGATFGAQIERRLADGWTIGLDPGFVQAGAGSLRVGPDVATFRLVYLEAPVTISRTFPILGGRWRVGPFAGAALGWLAGCGLRFVGQFHYGDCAASTPGGEPARVDASLPVGFTLRRRYAGGARIAIDVRYSRSLISVLSPGDLSARTQLFWMRFGFTLPLGGRGD